jgi:polyisoprenoid-binding protein YceI
MKNSLSILTILCLLPLAAYGVEFHVDHSKGNQVMFIFEMPLEDFEVQTNNIDGYVYWDGDIFPPQEPQLENSKLYFEVQLNSLDAGNGMYNRHMKEDYLETEDYPYASYSAQIMSIEPASDSSYAVHLSGVFSIHGQGKDLDIVGTAVSSGDGLEVKCDFSIKLVDYDIDLPKLMFIKGDEEIDVYLDFYIKRAF